MKIEEISEQQKAELSSIVSELEAAYWVPLLKTPFDGLNELEAKSKEDCPQLHQAFAAFNANLHAAKNLLEFPYLLLAPLLPSVQKHVAFFPSGSAGLDDSELSTEQRMNMIDLVTVTLKASHGPLLKQKLQLQRLLHQACLLIWSAIETFSKQVFIAALNQRPALFSEICKSQEIKDRFNISSSTWFTLLQKHDFDLNGKLGTIVAADRDFSSPKLLEVLFPAMFNTISTMGFPVAESQNTILRTLGQRRHLIAHRCGIVDVDYLEKTKDLTQTAGQLLRLQGRDVGSAMGAAAAYAILIYGNARYCWR